ncbi:hypothetical protein V8C86DRAFT_2762319 [Haematococcus lacustris]
MGVPSSSRGGGGPRARVGGPGPGGAVGSQPLEGGVRATTSAARARESALDRARQEEARRANDSRSGRWAGLQCRVLTPSRPPTTGEGDRLRTVAELVGWGGAAGGWAWLLVAGVVEAGASAAGLDETGPGGAVVSAAGASSRGQGPGRSGGWGPSSPLISTPPAPPAMLQDSAPGLGPSRLMSGSRKDSCRLGWGREACSCSRQLTPSSSSAPVPAARATVALPAPPAPALPAALSPSAPAACRPVPGLWGPDTTPGSPPAAWSASAAAG